jgi:hypothetical protein
MIRIVYLMMAFSATITSVYGQYNTFATTTEEGRSVIMELDLLQTAAPLHSKDLYFRIVNYTFDLGKDYKYTLQGDAPEEISVNRKTVHLNQIGTLEATITTEDGVTETDVMSISGAMDVSKIKNDARHNTTTFNFDTGSLTIGDLAIYGPSGNLTISSYPADSRLLSGRLIVEG